MRFQMRLVGMLAFMLVMPVFAGVPDDPAKVQSLSVGMRAPVFTVRTTEGALRTFKPDGYKKPTIVLFYRGGWYLYEKAAG